MASILDRYGIKEVADVTFYTINADGTRGAPALYLDTLKVSTIEQTAETADARGGKGNPKLITWDYGKEINVTIEDALFSSKSMAIMFGNGSVLDNSSDEIVRTVMVRIGDDGKLPPFFTADVVNMVNGKPAGSARKKVYMNDTVTETSDIIKYTTSKLSLVSLTKENGGNIDSVNFGGEASEDLTAWTGFADTALKGQKVFVTYKVPATTRKVVISGDSFPGTYYVTGDTYARSDVNGEDQFFQFIIQKAKVTSENTITLEAEGDPSTFSMNLTVLRPENGEMMQLVQYDLV